MHVVGRCIRLHARSSRPSVHLMLLVVLPIDLLLKLALQLQPQLPHSRELQTLAGAANASLAGAVDAHPCRTDASETSKSAVKVLDQSDGLQIFGGEPPRPWGPLGAGHVILL